MAGMAGFADMPAVSMIRGGCLPGRMLPMSGSGRHLMSRTVLAVAGSRLPSAARRAGYAGAHGGQIGIFQRGPADGHVAFLVSRVLHGRLAVGEECRYGFS